MIAVRAEVWRNGKFITHCHVRKDSDGAQFVLGADEQVPEGDYEIRNGDAVEKVTYKNGQWWPRGRAL